MSARDLYDTWIRRIRELMPDERVTRQRVLAWMLTGMHLSRSVHLSEMACRVPGKTKAPSTNRRFLANKSFRNRKWYRPIAEELLAKAARTGTIRLLIDGSRVGGGHQLLMVAVAYRYRALPIAWTWVKAIRGHSSAVKQIALLSYVNELIPDNASVCLVGDCEFGPIAVATKLENWNWKYALRREGKVHIRVSDETNFQPWSSFVEEHDKAYWFSEAFIAKTRQFKANALGFWKTGERDPWFIMTNLSSAEEALYAYRFRMWIEEMFGDWKSHGIRLDKTHLCKIARLSRLVFIVSLHYLWLLTRGSQTIKKGKRHLVDHKKKRRLSIYRIGYYMVQRLMTNEKYLPIGLSPYFRKLSGS